jgi:hypothetical protein
MTEAKLYYEVHLTFDPLVWQTDLYWNVIKALDKHHFRLASLTMASGEPHGENSFASSIGYELDEIKVRTAVLVKTLQGLGLTVRRYKIEDTVLDSRMSDALFCGVSTDNEHKQRKIQCRE